MKKEIIVTGEDVNAAVQNAYEALGASSSDEIDYEILDLGTKGFLGFGRRPTKIKASIEIPDNTPKRHSEARKSNSTETAETAHKRTSSGKEKQSHRNAPKKQKVAEKSEFLTVKYTPAGETETGIDLSYDFIRGVIADIGLNAEAELLNGEDGTRQIRISGEEAGALIGHHGETLDALQYLSNLACAKKNSKGERITSHVIIDIEGYREKREQTLRSLARRKAAEALRKKRSIILEPMSAYERRIIHSEIQTIDGVATNSIGADHNRKVVIYLDDSAAEDVVGGAEENNEI